MRGCGGAAGRCRRMSLTLTMPVEEDPGNQMRINLCDRSCGLVIEHYAVCGERAPARHGGNEMATAKA